MNMYQKMDYETPVLQIDEIHPDKVLCTSATTATWTEDDTYNYGELD